MAARVYSHRFHNHSVGNKTWTWSVPVDHLAVIKWASVTSYVPPPAQAGVYLNGVPLWFVDFQVVNTTRLEEIRGVAYEGDTIELYLSATSMMGHVSGYLFEGDSAALPGQLPGESYPGPPVPTDE